ncbi:MAG: hypothetical protein M3P83_00775 [Actinomycetota bacterium]|nr:hypothetical protein [Actinomycetota bacterium]
MLVLAAAVPFDQINKPSPPEAAPSLKTCPALAGRAIVSASTWTAVACAGKAFTTVVAPSNSEVSGRRRTRFRRGRDMGT